MIAPNPAEVAAHRRALVSPNPTCRRTGCLDHVPSGGGYPGMSQAHCYRCGMVTSRANDTCADFAKPIAPEIALTDVIADIWRGLFNRT